MRKKTYYLTVSTIFLIVGTLHLLRIVNDWEAVIGAYTVPMWFSWAAVALLGYLSVRGFSYSKKQK